jgi:ankyrin
LIENGADVNAKAKDGTTPLHDAMRFLSQELVDYLVQHGADPSIPNEDGKSVIELYPERFGNDKVSVPESEDMFMSQSEPEVTAEIVREAEVPSTLENQQQVSEMEIDQAKPADSPIFELPTSDNKEV